MYAYAYRLVLLNITCSVSVIIRSLSSSSVYQGQDGLSGGGVSASRFECLGIMLLLYSLFCSVSVILFLSVVVYPTYRIAGNFRGVKISFFSNVEFFVR